MQEDTTRAKCINSMLWAKHLIWRDVQVLQVLYTFLFFWLVVSTHLKNISQIGSFPQVGVKIKNLWTHHLVFVFARQKRTDRTTKKLPSRERIQYPNRGKGKSSSQKCRLGKGYLSSQEGIWYQTKKWTKNWTPKDTKGKTSIIIPNGQPEVLFSVAKMPKRHSKKLLMGGPLEDPDMEQCARDNVCKLILFMRDRPASPRIPAFLEILKNRGKKKFHEISKGDTLRPILTWLILANSEYFTNLDFPEIRGFPFLSYLLGWGRVKSL